MGHSGSIDYLCYYVQFNILFDIKLVALNLLRKKQTFMESYLEKNRLLFIVVRN